MKLHKDSLHRPTSIRELAQKMTEIFELDLQLIYKEIRENKRVILHSYADRQYIMVLV